jgi:uncharacterized protein (TIGR03067 family)
MRIRPFVLVMAAGLALAADKPKAETPPDDRQKLQGTWAVVSGEAKGKTAPEEAIRDVKWVVKGNTLTARTADGSTVKLTFKLDPGQKPRAIDLTNPERKETIQGIYLLEKDTWKVCLGAPGENRPRAFATRDNLKVILLVLRRAKP